MRLTDYDKLQLKLRAYADKKAANGEIELANGILKAKCFIDQECEIINEKQLSGGWIPVSERLPEEDEEVLVTTIGNQVCWAFRYLDEWNTCLSTFENNDVLAWMTLPEPYKEVE